MLRFLLLFFLFFLRRLRNVSIQIVFSRSDYCRTNQRPLCGVGGNSSRGFLDLTQKTGSGCEFVNNGVRKCGQRYRNWRQHFLSQGRAESERIPVPPHWPLAFVPASLPRFVHVNEIPRGGERSVSCAGRTAAMVKRSSRSRCFASLADAPRLCRRVSCSNTSDAQP